MAKQRYTATQVADTLQESNGLVGVAAERLGCTRRTVQRYIERYETVAQARDDARDNLTDTVEGKLIEKIKGGDTTAIIFYLKTQAKNRGYVERQEVTGAEGKPPAVIGIEIIKPNGSE